MKLKRLGLALMLLGLTITTVACSSEKTTSPSAITSPQPSNESSQATPSPTVKPSTSAQADSSSQVKPSTSSQEGSSSTVKPSTSAQASASSVQKDSSKIANGDQAAALVKKTIFNNNAGIVMAYNDAVSYNGFQCYPVKASSKSMQANGGSGTIGFYDVEIESGRIWDLSTNKIAIPN